MGSEAIGGGRGGAGRSANMRPEWLEDGPRRVAVADSKAFGVIIRRHVTAVHAFVQRRCRSIDLADDLTAAAFEKAWRALPSFRNGEGASGRGSSGSPPTRWRATSAAVPVVGASGSWPTRIAHRQRRRTSPARSIGRARSALAARRAPPRSDHAAIPRRPVDRRDGEALGITRAHVAVLSHRALGALRSAIASIDGPAQDAAIRRRAPSFGANPAS